MIFLAIILSYASFAVAGNLTAVYKWNYLDYLFDSDEHRQAAVDNGSYVRENVLLIDVDVHKDKVFVTTPRIKDGVPATLSTLANQTGLDGPLLKPYPDWSWHTRKDCKGITSVWRVAIDECNRLWVLDSGLKAQKKVCPASLIVFDAETDKLLNRYDIPNEVLHTSNTTGSLVTPVVETNGPKCKDTWVYLANVAGHSLIVWHNNVTWRLSGDVYAPSPDAKNFTIAGESFELNDGVVGLALSPASKKLPHRKLFFKPLSSYNQFSVNVNNLHISRRFPIRYKKSSYKLSSQGAAQDFSYRGVLFFGLVSEMAIACWDMKKPFNADNVVTVAQDNKYLQFASGLKVKRLPVRELHGEYLWVATNRFQKFKTGTQNFNETNFVISVGPVAELIARTRCHS